MIERLAKEIVLLKKELARERKQESSSGGSNISEVIPDEDQLTKKFQIEPEAARQIHLFASENPIYHSRYQKRILDVKCTIYEGDIDEYWLGSISHQSSHAPFSPTWVFSALLLAMQAKAFGYKEIIDVGSGDGRIAYCGKILGMNSYSIEIDEELARLQDQIKEKTEINFDVRCSDVTRHDFGEMELQKPIFCIGGLAQMGGNVLASSIIENPSLDQKIKKESGFVFAGTYAKKYPESEMDAGWGRLIQKNGLRKTMTVSLPTAWTFKEPEETPYVFASF